MRPPDRVALFAPAHRLAEIEAALQDDTGAACDTARIELAWYLRQCDTSRALQLLHDARARLPADEATWPPRMHLVHAEAHRLANRLEAASQALQQAEAGFAACGDLVGIADVRCLQLAIAMARDGPADIEAAFDVAARAYDACGDPVRVHFLAMQRAVFDTVAGLDVMSRWGDAIDAARALGDPVVEAVVANVEGALINGTPSLALPHYERCHALAMQTGQRRLELAAAISLADLHEGLGQLDTALAWVQRAGLTAQSWPRNHATALNMAATLLRRLGRLEEALLASDQCLALRAGVTEASDAYVHAVRAMILLDLGRPDDALACLARAEDLARRFNHLLNLQIALTAKARALSATADVDAAMAAADEALACARNPVHRVEALREKARIAERHGLGAPDGSAAASGAIHHLEDALATASAVDRMAVPAALHAELSHAYESAGNLREALVHARLADDARAHADQRKAQELATAMQSELGRARERAEAARLRELVATQAARADAAAAASDAKSTFLAHMSHELRSPLNALLGMARLVERAPELPQSLRSDMEVVVRCGAHLHALINQVLTLSKIEADRVEVADDHFDLHGLLDEIVAVHAAAVADKGLDLALARADDVPCIVASDPIRLRQVLLNLLGNAIKFTAAGGVRLEVRAGPVADGRCVVTLRVADTGVGIAADELPRLGGAFVQAHAGRQSLEGTGLGLAICRGFVQRVGGTLAIDSTPGAGTVVTVAWPVVVPDEPKVRARVPAPHVRGLAPGQGEVRILVADDLADNRRLLVRWLSGLGFVVQEAADGAEAIARWREWAPQLILMDLRMPGIDGREATRRIKADPRGQDTVVIALTASSFEEERSAIVAIGCDDFMRKPFEEDALLQMLARHLGLRYAVDDEPAHAPAPRPEVARLADTLPQPVRERLLASLDRLDVQAIDAAMAEVAAASPALAEALAPMARRFQYERMRALLRLSGH